MVGEHRAVVLAQLLDELRRPLDVREEEVTAPRGISGMSESLPVLPLAARSRAASGRAAIVGTR
jgi:hypothetical protein